MNTPATPAEPPVQPRPDAARADLARFDALAHPPLLTADAHLPRALKRLMGPAWDTYAAHFAAFGATVIGPLDAAAIANNHPETLPHLARWAPFGDRIEQIDHHPSYEVCGRHIYQDGELIAAYAAPVGTARNVRATALMLLSAHAGEAGHNCPVACTVGVVKSLRAAGSDALQARWLPGLLTADYATRLHGAQFMTEVQGGSDVAQNAVRATPDGTALGTTRWKITGEKWFCSNPEADLILLTARVESPTGDGGARPGTAGLGLFLLPRRREDGSLNAFTIRRLKEKLGTRSMPSAELDFHGATAYAVGPVADGFKTMMTHVIQTSRLYNTFAVVGAARRAFIIARAYAQTRHAFGEAIAAFPLVHAMLAEQRALYAAPMAGGLALAALLDREEAGTLRPSERAFFRVMVNLVKMRSAQHAHRGILIGIEMLGGNGAIESFSILPRLLRDNVVYENWEGTHNVLIVQTLRDLTAGGLGEAFLKELTAFIAEAAQGHADLGAALAPAQAAVSAAQAAVTKLARQGDPNRAALLFRPHAERLADAFFAAAWAADLAPEEDPTQRAGELAALNHFAALELVPGGLTWDEARADQVAQIAALER